jgi:hypothetical protein
LYKPKIKKEAKKVKTSDFNSLIDLNIFKTTFFIKKTKKSFISILKKSIKSIISSKKNKA